METRAAAFTPHIGHHDFAPRALREPLKQVQPTTPLDLCGQQLLTIFQPLLGALQIPCVETLKFRERLPGTVCKLAQGKGQVATGAAIVYRYVLLRAQLYQSFNAETGDRACSTVDAGGQLGPRLELVEVANDKGLADLQTFGEPLGKG